jgi:hypothetical protein
MLFQVNNYYSPVNACSALLECAHFLVNTSFSVSYGGFRWFPRNKKLLTWSDPEGSSHSGGFMCRGVADGSHHLFLNY